MRLFIVCFLLVSSGVFAQVTNRTQVYVNPGTEVHVVGDFSNSTGGSSFTLDEEAVLYVGADVNNNGTMTLENDASLLRGATSADGGSGSYVVKRQSTSANIYSFFSAPVTNHSGFPGSLAYAYDETLSTQYPDDDQDPDPGWVSPGGIMNPGEGYACLDAGLATFSGSQVNNGNVSIGLNTEVYDPASSAAGTPFNLVGNPYPSGLDLEELVTDNPNVFGSIYLWADDFTGGSGYSASDYAVWNLAGTIPASGNSGANGTPAPNGYIKTGQAFMLRNDNAPNLTFNNSQRVENTLSNAFYRSSAPSQNNGSRVWLSINGPDETYFNQILVALLDDATNNEDRLYDAVKMVGGGASSTLSSFAHGNNYAILAFPPPQYAQTIPLNLTVDRNESYVFKADVMEGFNGMEVYFVDNLLGTNILLEEGIEIPVALNEGEYTNRFYLNFSSPFVVGVDEVHEASLDAWVNQNLLYIQSNEQRVQQIVVDIFDAKGSLVLNESENLNLGINTLALNELSKGIYVMRITSDNDVLSKQVYLD